MLSLICDIGSFLSAQFPVLMNTVIILLGKWLRRLIASIFVLISFESLNRKPIGLGERSTVLLNDINSLSDFICFGISNFFLDLRFVAQYSDYFWLWIVCWSYVLCDWKYQFILSTADAFDQRTALYKWLSLITICLKRFILNLFDNIVLKPHYINL